MKRLFTGVATALVLTTFSTAETPVDTESQSSMFKRIFNYDKANRILSVLAWKNTQVVFPCPDEMRFESPVVRSGR
jgi:hypothetical protein